MNRILFALIAVCAMLLSGPAQAQEWGEIREATQNLNVRQKRSPKADHVVTLAKGQRVKVDFLKDGWFAVFNLNESERDESRAVGYSNANYLVPVEPTPRADAPTTSIPSRAQTDVEGAGAVKAAVDKTPPPDPITVGIDPTRIPVKITSDRMTYDENGKVVSFVGNVMAEHGKLKLWADRLSAFFGSKSGKQFSVDSVDRIVAEGNVKAQRGETTGSCGRVTYFVEKQLLRMEDDPMLQDGPNSLTGDVINFYVRENRSEVVGGDNKRVRAIFLTPKNIEAQ